MLKIRHKGSNFNKTLEHLDKLSQGYIDIKCEDCGHIFYAKAGLVKCPKCGKEFNLIFADK